MAIKTVDEIMESVKARIGEDNSDDALAFIEDINDTLKDMSEKASVDNSAEWEEKYNALDNEWRAKYKERFFNKSVEEALEKEKETESDEEVEQRKMSYDDLFKEE